MNFNQMTNKEWRRSFMIVFLAIISFFSLLMNCFFVKNDNPVMQIGLLILVVICILAMFFLLLDNLKSLNVMVNSATVQTGITLSNFKGEHKTVETVTGYVSEQNISSTITTAETALSTELRKTVGTKWSEDHCREGLDLLARNESVVRDSWTHTLNKARLLRAVGETERAEAIVQDVMKRFCNFAQAMGTAYEVLSWFEEFKEPQKKGVLYRQWLLKRLEYVIKGLEFFPTGYYLLMNAFEIAVLQNTPDEALKYLNRAIAVDPELVRANLLVNPLTRKAMRLSPELKETIQELIGGNNRMKIFQMLKSQSLILVLVITAALNLSAIPLQHQIKAIPANKAITSAFRIPVPEQVKSFICFLDSAGTGLGRALANNYLSKDGTGLGRR